MAVFILRRILSSVPVLIGVTLAAFLLLQLVPGDPVQVLLFGSELPANVSQEYLEQMREELGLNDPLPVRYGRFLHGVVTGDLGVSIKTGRPVVAEIVERLPFTIQLAVAGMGVAVVLGVVMGVVAAAGHGTSTDTITMLAAVAGVSTPSFWLGLMLALLFGVHLGWLPVYGSGTWRHLVLPALTLGFGAAAIIARMTRSGVLEVLRQDYIRTARAKGLAERVVLYRHALKNALIPVVTVVGVQAGALLGGTVIVESVFAWPGLGRLTINAIAARDLPQIQAVVMLVALMYVGVNLLVDLLYSWLDPRIRYQ
ncbi:MAG TPA: nickel ABC transporter permease [Bacillota bacterium]